LDNSSEKGKSCSNWQRLENPKTSNPALKTIVKLKKALPDLNIEQIISG